MKKHVLFILASLLFVAMPGVGTLHADVIDDGITYVDVGQTDVINAIAINEVTLKVCSSTTAFSAYAKPVFESQQVILCTYKQAITWRSIKLKATKHSIHATTLDRNPRAGLATSLLIKGN